MNLGLGYEAKNDKSFLTHKIKKKILDKCHAEIMFSKRAAYDS